MNNLEDWRDKILRGLEALRGTGNLPEDYLQFRIDLARAYAKVRSSLKETAAEPPSQKKRPGRPLKSADVPFDRAAAKGLLDDILLSLSNRSRKSEDLSRIAEEAEKEADSLLTLVREAVFKPGGKGLKEMADKTGISLPNLILTGRMLAAPFLIEAASGMGFDSSDPGSAGGGCPACGSPPALARLRRDDGKRLLVCSLCETEWEYPRLQCPFCQNRDQDEMGTLAPKGSEARWFEICDQCKHYIKTVDERKLPAGERATPFVEETLTLYLDLVAEREGYSRVG